MKYWKRRKENKGMERKVRIKDEKMKGKKRR